MLMNNILQHKSLEVINISKSFYDNKSRRLILNEVSFSVGQNEIFGFIGLNGIGKTTVIKIILDLLDQDDGDAEIFGVKKILPESRKKLCYLPEKFHPSSHLKGAEFLKFVLDFYGKKLDVSRAEELCKNLDLRYESLQQKVTSYSKGMTQKLGLIAVFLSDADLIVLDEPFSGLDPKARIKLKRELLAYKKLGKTIFFSSHILSDMDEICDSIAVLNNAKIVYDGTPEGFKIKHKTDRLDDAFLKEIGEI
jgi:ABC-2 type transport system ATP-binding protein